ncbi:CAF17-like 4Fe-4S cluster assembly/insertion protein YgfZ [Undibacterium terreum]|uniref:Folate-binding protein n=1 Tax=Undibacterium terreum TaxID=1224302 RepID=A0A916XRY8_9BURK|nr:folate-binding protein YgfZ [Undibacterium terreum]GGD01857.1 folate-binding protein [Undibacterium terreum]
MTTWQQFLAQYGAQLSTKAGANEGTGISMDSENLNASLPAWNTNSLQTGFVAPLADLGLIRVQGDDAASFLHNQLTNDIEGLGLTEAKLAAYCSPKGRMIASFLSWKTSEGIFLQLSRDIQAPIQKRLSMFVLRAKAKLADVSTEQLMLGLGGQAAADTLKQWFPTLPLQAYAKTDNEYGSLIRVPDADGVARYQWISTAETLEQAWPALSASLAVTDASAWRLTEIQAGIPRITVKTQEQFVPQMVNFELIGGVNFRKGCYPGQEIVARSQYLGKLRRRMAIAVIASNEVAAAMEVFNGSDATQPCGMIVNAEICGENQSLCLVEMKVADQEAGDIRLGSNDGIALEFQPLPYAVLDITQ